LLLHYTKLKKTARHRSPILILTRPFLTASTPLELLYQRITELELKISGALPNKLLIDLRMTLASNKPIPFRFSPTILYAIYRKGFGDPS
jgi:hypothetical protein